MPPFIIKAVISYAIPLIVEAVVELGAEDKWEELDLRVQAQLEKAVNVPAPLRKVAFKAVDWLTDVASAILSDNKVVRDSIVALAKQDYLAACEVLRKALFDRFLHDPLSPVSEQDKASISAALAKEFAAHDKGVE